MIVFVGMDETTRGFAFGRRIAGKQWTAVLKND
jgi:hypothetical protein